MAAVIGAARRGRADRRGDRRLRRARQRQLHPPGRARRRDRGRRAGGRAARRSAATARSALPVSHAFHTEIVAPASEPLRATLQRLGAARRRSSRSWPTSTASSTRPGDGVEEQMLDILGRQVASPVQFVKGLQTLYDAGARVFVEVGPKRALQGFAADVLGDDVLTLATNHPKVGDVASFNQALCGLYAAGLGAPVRADRRTARSAGARRRAGGHHRRRARARPAPSRFRRRQPRAPAPRRAVHRRDPGAGAPRDRRAAHHAPRQGRGRQRHASRRSTTPPTSSSWPARAGAFDLGEEFGVDADRARGARARDAAGDRRRHRRAARRRHPARPALQGHHARAPSCPTAGACPTRCATTPA